jgi:hypothetical protein
VTYKNVVRFGNSIYLLHLMSQQIAAPEKSLLQQASTKSHLHSCSNSSVTNWHLETDSITDRSLVLQSLSNESCVSRSSSVSLEPLPSDSNTLTVSNESSVSYS